MDVTKGEPRGVELRRLAVDDWRLWRGLRLAALEEAPYAFSSKLSDWTGAGDLESRWTARLASVPFNVVAALDGSTVGIVSAARPAHAAAQLISMWVAPSARGQGIGDALIEAVVTWSRENDAKVLYLDVFEDNKAAVRLYRRHGFRDRSRKPSEPDDDPVRVERRMERQLD